ncbi:MAG: TonB family protein [Acidobacteriota bacterium]
MIKQQFGPYVLFKKLGHDPLGETFRAGRVQGNSVGQVVLLRVYNGTAIAQQAIESALRERHDLTRHVRGPQIAPSIDHGRLDGVPYSAYEYSSSQDLRTITDLARKRGQPVPKEQAVAILERLAQGLRTASESDYKGRGVHHGFLVPELVQISTEGEVRLLGFEVGEALRRGASGGSIDPEHQRFLAPEAAAGTELTSADDVFSLGVLLLELMTNARATDAQSRDELLTRLEATQSEIAGLVRKSLGPASERIPNVVEWHDTIGEIVPQSGPSTFQLAFYLHNLLKDEIAKEARERLDESDVAIPVQVAAETAAVPVTQTSESPLLLTDSGSLPTQPVPLPAPELPTPTDSQELLATSDVLDQVLREPAEPKPESAPAPAAASASSSGRRLGPMLAAAALVTTAVGAGAFYGPDLLQRGTTEEPQSVAAMQPDLPKSTPEPVDVQSEDAEAAAALAAEAAAEEQAVLQEIDRLVTERAARLEKSLRSEYDKEIELLRQQLDETRETAARSAAAPRPVPVTARPETRPEPKPGLGEPSSPPAPIQEARVASAVPRSSEESAPPETDLPSASEDVESAPEQEPAETRTAKLEEQETDTFVEPVVVPPNLVKPASPRYPPVAQRHSKEAIVELRVFVEIDGSVSQVRPIGKHGYGFDEAAARAARAALFEPGSRDGVAVSTWTTMRVRFQLK